jgi:hypothetical protein
MPYTQYRMSVLALKSLMSDIIKQSGFINSFRQLLKWVMCVAIGQFTEVSFRPSKNTANVGEAVSFALSYKINSKPPKPKVLYGIGYVDGPTDAITVYFGGGKTDLKLGTVVAIVNSDPKPGDSDTVYGRIVFGQAGHYVVDGVTLLVDGDMVRDAREVQEFDVSGAAPVPKEERPAIPVWIPVAIAGAVAAGIGTYYIATKAKPK